MKRIYTIREDLAVEWRKKKKKTVVTVIDKGTRKILADIKTDEYFWCNVVYDENYIVVYSRGCMANQIPLNIEAAFSVKTRRFLNVANKRFKVLLEYMLIFKKGFDIPLVLQTINTEDLGIVEEDEKDALARYLSAGSDKVSRNEIVQYILKQYPVLEKYSDLSDPISVIRYKKLVEEIEDIIGEDTFWFHVMPLPLECLSNPSETPDDSDRCNYRQIYLSEYENSVKQ